MIKWISVGIVSGVTWYILNAARVAWREGNKGGAAVISVLAATAFAIPIGLLFFWQK